MVFFVLPVLTLSFPAEIDKYSPLLSWVKREYSSLELATVDYRIRFGRRAPVDPRIVYLAIDSASTSTYLDSNYDSATIAASPALSLMHSRFPYPRDVWALVADKLFAAGARVVAFDLIFPGPSDNDLAWKNAIEKYKDKIVIASNFDFDLRNYKTPSLSIPSSSLLPDQDPFAIQLAYVNYWTDVDDIVRNAQYRNNLENVNHLPGAENLPKLYSLAARAVQKGGNPEIVPEDLQPRTIRFAGPPLVPFLNYSLYKIFDKKMWETTFQNGEFFRDKIVVVAPQGDFVKDKSSTPYGLMDGAEIHLNSINSLLQNQFLSPASKGLITASVLGAGLLSLLLALTIIPIGWRFLAVASMIIGYTMASVSAYNGPGWLLPNVGPMLVYCGATGVGFIYDFLLNQIEKQRLRSTFERYNSTNVAKYLLDHVEHYEKMLAGTRRPITALFSDIRGFTTLAEEAADTQKLVAKLNEYLTAMVDVVFRQDGTLDSFMGDGIMASWGTTPFNFGPKGDAVRAVQAALAMIVELRKLNAKWIAEGGTAWKIGIGLNHGEVIVGDIGSKQHSEFAAIGDAVNLASRIEGLTKEYHVEILIGESVANLVRDEFHLRSVDRVQAKGKNKPVEIFTVVGEKSTALPPEEQRFLALYEEGITCFRQREFARPKELFSQAAQIHPDDFLAADYLEDCDEYIATPPGAAWTGVRVMTKK